MKSLKHLLAAGLFLLLTFPIAGHTVFTSIQDNPPPVFINGQRVTPYVDIHHRAATNSDSRWSERCGSSRRRPHKYHYSRNYSTYTPYSCNTNRYYDYYDNNYDRGYGRGSYIKERWEYRLEGYWQEERGWRQYEIEVHRHYIQIKRAGWFNWHKLYPVELHANKGYFANDHGDFLEWDNGTVLWHLRGKRIKPLYPR